jgi:nitroimidazol reductase NimA-like FMN-containing flavoprotein (pyridoxamine 5'-phosphate oxidase superfamily)
LRANSESHDRVCFETSNTGKLLPSNVALEFSIQYESVIVFGRIRLLDDPEAKERALYGLVAKYFPGMSPGKHYRPISAQELKRTAVFAIAVNRWSGKRNWSERAEQSDKWPELGPEWFE